MISKLFTNFNKISYKKFLNKNINININNYTNTINFTKFNNNNNKFKNVISKKFNFYSTNQPRSFVKLKLKKNQKHLRKKMKQIKKNYKKPLLILKLIRKKILLWIQ